MTLPTFNINIPLPNMTHIPKHTPPRPYEEITYEDGSKVKYYAETAEEIAAKKAEALRIESIKSEAREKYSKLEFMTFAEMVRRGDWTLTEIKSDYGEGAMRVVMDMQRDYVNSLPAPSEVVRIITRPAPPKKGLSFWRKVQLFFKAVMAVLRGEMI